ncbi:unnamed protein product [Arabis nemorensis]|uniref:Uncharacterized protein n=1 Tax=Arabis nemorensis TaxID=586526 RepID=A0A565AP79_9BRAS|nr:unnamed protein product [Arabis nemorensis]
MRSENDQVFRNSIEITEEEAELKIPKNRDSLEDLPVFYTDKNVTACELPEIVVSNYKELTYKVVKDICVDESLPMMKEKDSIEVNSNPFESKSSEEGNKFEEVVGIQDSSKLNQDNLIVTREEVKVDSEVTHEVGCEKSPSRDVVVASPGSVSKETLTLGDIISREDSLKPSNNNGPEKTEESKANNLRDLDHGNFEPENERLNYVLEDSYDHQHLFSSKYANGFEERSFSEAEPGLAHITYSGPISVSGSLSVGSDGSTISTHSFAFPILQSEWNSSPARMAKPEKRPLGKKKGWRHYSLLLCCRF